MKTILIGAVTTTRRVLETMVEVNFPISYVFSLDDAVSENVSDYDPVFKTAEKFNVPYKKFKKINDEENVKIIKEIEPDYIFVIGLSQLVKDEIINMYLNKFDFLYNAVGIQSAASVYFGKTPKTLSIEEAATLVGMCKNPSYFNPVRRNERTRGRRNTVLDQMQKAGYITQAECDSLKKLPLKLRFKRIDHKEGLAPYFREYLRMTLTAKKPNRKNYASWQEQKFKEVHTLFT